MLTRRTARLELGILLLDTPTDRSYRGVRARWSVRPPLPAGLRTQLDGLSVMVAHLLHCRGLATVEEIREFLAGDTVSHDPFLLPDMADATERIATAVEGNERVAIYGDFDCDGITAAAVLLETLRAAGLEPLVHIPERADGHGLHPDSLAALRNQGSTLVVTADCGITAIDEVQVAHGLGMDVIVTDHHEPRPDGLLPRCPVVAPTRLHSGYPFRGLCGAGVVYKLAQALARRMPDAVRPETLLDLVALGTVADVVPLRDENRSLVIAGLDALRSTGRPGLLALFRAAGVDPRQLDPVSIGYYLAPRINAANRMATPRFAYDLLTTTDPATASELADRLSDLNRRRQTVVETMLAALLADLGDPATLAAAVAAGDRPPVLVAMGDWPPGISGLLASKLVDTYGLPAFVGTRDGETVVVSGRGTAGARIDELLELCEGSRPGGIFLGYGGHAGAGGFRVHSSHWPEVEAALTTAARHQKVACLDATLEIDAEVTLRQLTFEAARLVRSLAPFGMGFPEPLFLTRGVVLASKKPMGGEKHMRVRLRQGGTTISGVLFHAPEAFTSLPLESPLDVVFHLVMNDWNGTVTVETRLRDWRIAT